MLPNIYIWTGQKTLLFSEKSLGFFSMYKMRNKACAHLLEQEKNKTKNENPNWYWNQLLIWAYDVFNGEWIHFIISISWLFFLLLDTSKAKLCKRTHNWNRLKQACLWVCVCVCVCVKERNFGRLKSQNVKQSKVKQIHKKLQFDLCWTLAHWVRQNKFPTSYLIFLFYTWKKLKLNAII